MWICCTHTQSIIFALLVFVPGEDIKWHNINKKVKKIFIIKIHTHPWNMKCKETLCTPEILSWVYTTVSTVYFQYLCVYIFIEALWYFATLSYRFVMMVWHRFADNSSQYWGRIIRLILGGRREAGQQAAYLLQSSLIFYRVEHFLFDHFANIFNISHFSTRHVTSNCTALDRVQIVSGM